MASYAALRQARIRKGWSIYRLAKEARVSRSYITALENGEADNPGLDTISRVFKALEVGEACLVYERLRYRLSLKIIPELFRNKRSQSKP